MKSLRSIDWLGSLCWTLIAAAAVSADDTKRDEPPHDPSKIQVETVLTGLDHPCGIALQPKSDHVFIAESGAGQIVRFTPTKPNVVEPIITGFPGRWEADIGPTGLAFLQEYVLVVAGGESNRAEDALRIFNLPSGGKSIDYSNAKQRLEAKRKDPPAGGDTAKGVRHFYSLAVYGPSSPQLFATCQSSDGTASLVFAEIKGRNFLAELQSFAEIRPMTGVDAPVALAISDRGLIVIAGREKADSPVCNLSFLNRNTATAIATMPTDLHDIVALAYSPKSGRLYAADFASKDSTQAGIYRLDGLTLAGRPAIKSVRIAAIEHPMALVFTSENTLFATAFGADNTPMTKNQSPKGSPSKSGTLIKITGDL